MSFPTSPTNGQQATVNGIVYNYNSTKGAWIKNVTTAGTLTTGNLVITSNTASTNTTNGALVVGGGVGVTGNLNAGSAGSQHRITGNVGIGTVGAADGSALTIARVVPIADFRADFNLTSPGGAILSFNSNTSGGSYNQLVQNRDALIYYSQGTIDTGALTVGQWSNSPRGFRIGGTGVVEFGSAGNVVVASTTTSTSTTTGALIVRGGAGIAGNIVVGDSIISSVAAGFGSVSSRFTANIGTKADFHISTATNGSSATATQQYGITFAIPGGDTQAAIIISENNNDGTAIGLFTTNSYAAGPQLRWSVSPAGFVNTPAQPFFLGRPANDYSGGGMPTSTAMPTTAIINNGSHFNASTNRFTAPIAGYYKATWGGLQLPSTVTSLMVNGVRTHNGNHFPAASPAYITMTQTAIVLLAANDYLTIEQWNGGGYYREWYLWSVELIG